MAQTLKDEIRQQILAAALEEFYLHGFSGAAMRSIAESAKVPVGLIYSYFRNKEALFGAVVCPVCFDWEAVLENGTRHEDNPADLSETERACILTLLDHRKESIVLLDKSEGTEYELEKEKMIQAVEVHLTKHLKDRKDFDPVFIHIIVSGFVDGLLQIMYHFKSREWAMKILDRLINMYFIGIG